MKDKQDGVRRGNEKDLAPRNWFLKLGRKGTYISQLYRFKRNITFRIIIIIIKMLLMAERGGLYKLVSYSGYTTFFFPLRSSFSFFSFLNPKANES